MVGEVNKMTKFEEGIELFCKQANLSEDATEQFKTIVVKLATMDKEALDTADPAMSGRV